MLSLPADPSLDASGSTSLLMPNSFLIFRSVSFALLSNLALLQLIFASWNIAASLLMTHSAPSTSIFIVFGSCVLFLSVACALADYMWSRGRKSPILLECSWVGILSLFQIGTAIGTTLTEPGMACDTSLAWNVCASSLLLIPSTWLSSTLSLAYFLALLMTTMSHKDLYSDIWRRSVYGIVWFGQKPQEIFSKGNVTGRLNVDPNVEDIENSSSPKELHISGPVEFSLSPPKATNSIRRGIDSPFSRQPSSTRSSRSSDTVSSLALPSCPSKSAKSERGSRFIETFHESTSLARPESLEHFIANYQVHKDPFPPFPVDVDAPIPLPHLSEWVRADALRGIRFHTNPHTGIDSRK